MSKDISKLLSQWQFNPEEVLVRIIQGEDGQEKVQLRVDLGLLQMEIDGRPDGQTPEGCVSWFDYYRQQQEAYDSAHADSAPFELEDKALSRLWAESIQYYHRYLSFWHLEKYELCARDTQRNLRLFDFIKEHVPNDRAKLQFEQWRPYVVLMHAKAVATPLVEMQQYDTAVVVVEAGIDDIEDFLERYHQLQQADHVAELIELRQWLDVLQMEHAKQRAAQGESPLEMLRRQLQEAIEGEQFEEAAQLRDEIRRLIEEENA